MRSLILLLFVASCTLGPDPADPADVTAATVTRDQFQQLSWIIGKWRGAEAGGTPFFESYRMIDDSTFKGITWADSSFSSAKDSSVISLRNGEVTSGSSAVVTKWDGTTIHFEPRGPAANSFTWKKESPDRWTALLQWQEKGQPKERTYIMTRVAE